MVESSLGDGVRWARRAEASSSAGCDFGAHDESDSAGEDGWIACVALSDIEAVVGDNDDDEEEGGSGKPTCDEVG